MNFIKYQIAATTENADLITAITKLMLEAGQVDTPVTDAKAAPAKETTKPKATKTAPAKETTKAEEVEEAADVPTLSNLKDAIKAARSAHGGDFCKAVLIANGATDSTLGRMASAIDEDSYADTIAQLNAGPKQAADDLEEDGLGDEDDEFGDDEDDSEVTVEAVKLAAKAYAKEVGRVEAKDIMNANGAAALSKIDECTPAQLKAMFKAFTA